MWTQTGLKNQFPYQFLPPHLPKSMGCRVRVTGIISLDHQSQCSSCTTTEGTHRNLLPQSASSMSSDGHCTQGFVQLVTEYLTSSLPAVNTSLLQIILIFHRDQAMYTSSGTWHQCSSSCSRAGQSSPCSGVMLEPRSCAGCVQAASHTAVGPMPLGTNISHLSQSSSQCCKDLCDLGHVAPVVNWLCRWGQTGSAHTP